MPLYNAPFLVSRLVELQRKLLVLLRCGCDVNFLTLYDAKLDVGLLHVGSDFSTAKAKLGRHVEPYVRAQFLWV